MRFDSSKTGSSVVVQELEFAINLALYGLLWSLGNQYIVGSLSWPSLTQTENLTGKSFKFKYRMKIIFSASAIFKGMIGSKDALKTNAI